MSSRFVIFEVEPESDTLVYNTFEAIHYRDGFRISLNKGDIHNIDYFADRYFTSQPLWLRVISMHILNREKLISIVENTDYKIGSKVGTWKVFDRSDKEIVFGESLGFMDYRFSMRFDKGDAEYIEVSTVVKTNSTAGKFYFALVKLLHRKFVMISLRNACRKLPD